MEKITGAFPKLLAQLDTSPEAVEALVFEAWRRSVGDALNEQTAPVEILGTTLKVAVVNETLRRHLADMASEILISLNGKLAGQQVTYLNFIVDAVSEVLRISKEQLAPPPPTVSGLGRDYLTGLAKLEKRLLILLDVDRLLSDVSTAAQMVA